MSIVSFVRENDNPFPAELRLGIVPPCEKKIPICKLVDPDWWCIHRPNYSVLLYKILVYYMRETVILDYELSCVFASPNIYWTSIIVKALCWKFEVQKGIR